jgi:cysteine desulfurase
MVQALGKTKIDLKKWDVDLASFSGHKFYSLKGAGFLFAKTSVKITPLIHGGGQERGRRAGTENALAIFSLGEALRVLAPKIESEISHIESLRNDLEEKISKIPGTIVNGKGAPRVCNTINVCFPDIDGESLLINLDLRGFAVSSGAACSSGTQEASPVLIAMGLSQDEASRSLRISLGWLTTTEELNQFYKALLESLQQIWSARKEYMESEDTWLISAP